MWTKRGEPLIPFPPSGDLVGFRDPYIIQRGDGAGKPWKLIVGSGIKGQGGTLLLYTSPTLLEGWFQPPCAMLLTTTVDVALATHGSAFVARWQMRSLVQKPLYDWPLMFTMMVAGWQYQGMFTQGKSRPCDDWDLGEMWECPFFVELPDTAGSGGDCFSDSYRLHTVKGWPCHGYMQVLTTGCMAEKQAAEEVDCPGTAHVLCISPYPHYRKDRPTNPCLYWVGACDGSTFNVEAAEGTRSQCSQDAQSDECPYTALGHLLCSSAACWMCMYPRGA